MMRRNSYAALAAAIGLIAGTTTVHATPYASGVSIDTNTKTVSFILNQPSSTLTYSINGGAPVALNGATTGSKSFTLGALTDKFTIVADNTDAGGYSVPMVGTTIPQAATHFTIDTQAANITIGGVGQISSDANGLMHYNSPRGVDIGNNPNAATFGTAYISNSADQTGTPFTGRTALLNKGLYAIKADGSDAYGYGDVAQQQVWAAASANSPHRFFLADDGTPYVGGFADAISGVFRLSPDMQTITQMLFGVNGPNAIDITQANHGSVYKTIVTGSPAAGNLKIYTLDEDLSSLEVNPSGGGLPDNTNRLWKYDLGSYDPGVSGPFATPPVSVTPDAVRGPLLDATACGGSGTGAGCSISFIDMDRGADGKFYLSQNRSVGSVAGVYIVNPDGTTAWNSLTATQALPGQATTNDIFQNTNAVAVSPDQKWIAVLHGDNFITVAPLINGIPDLANRLAITTDVNLASARDINFDAADNLYYISSGQALMREFSLGGHTTTTLSYDPSLAAGSQYAFNLATGSVAIAGDFNGDGKVDAADYVALRKMNSDITTGTGLANYTAWRTHYGTNAGSGLGGSPVPEPGTIALVAFGLVAVGGFRRRQA